MFLDVAHFCSQDILMGVVRGGLADKDPETQELSSKLLDYLPSDAVEEFIDSALKEDDILILKKVIPSINRIGVERQAKLASKLYDAVTASLNSDLPQNQIAATDIIKYSPWEKRIELVELALNSCMEPAVIRRCVRYIKEDISENQRHKFVKIVIERGFGKFLIEPPLYNNKNITSESFTVSEFPKNGSESKTFLFGGELKNKTILRRLEPECFAVWQTAFEHSDWWQEAGFEYVPIEPIQSFRLRSDSLVDAYTGVLDLSLNGWMYLSNDFVEELEEDKRRILSVLSKNNLSFAKFSSHLHDGNFCLKFIRDERGNPDFTKKPKIYLIDFDLAEFQLPAIQN